MDDLTAANIAKSARAAAIAGDRAEAVRLYRRALDIQPDDKNAWMELAGLLDDAAEKRKAVARVLALDPFHEEAKAVLARLDGHEPGHHTDPDHTLVAEPDTLYCANHPRRETMLRCNKCNKPICMECSVRTPVGYRCKECVRGQQDKFYTATTSNQALGYGAAALSGLLLGIAAILFGIFAGGFFGILIAIFIGPAIGGGLAALIFRAAGRKRARNFNVIATIITVIIAAPLSLALLVVGGSFLSALILVGLAASTLYARLR